MLRRAVTVVALLGLVGCSSSENRDAAVSKGTDSPSPSPASAVISSTTPQPGQGVSPARGASSAGSQASTASTRPNSGASATSAPVDGGNVDATPAGTYTYDSSGSQTFSGAKKDVASSSTLTVSAAKDGRQSSALHNSQGDTTQELVVRSTGSYLAALTINSPTLNKEFRFSPVALLLPDPAKVGASWSWRGTSTDGSTTVSATTKVLRYETLTIGGERVPTFVLQTHLAIAGDNLTYTADATNWAAPAYRLPVKTHTTGSGTYGTFSFAFDVTDVVRSVHPS